MKHTHVSCYNALLILAGMLTLAPGCSKKTTTPDKPSATANPPLVKSTMGYGTTSGLGRVMIDDQMTSGATTRLEVAIWRAYVDGEHNSVNVGVDPGFVLVGGGAQVADLNGNPNAINALLTSMYPVNDGTFTTFSAASKDHSQVYNHRLYVYAIGVRLYGPTGAIIPTPDIIPHFHIRSITTTTPASHPFVDVPGPGMLSGGADIHYGTGRGNLLVQNTMSLGSPGIIASGKDHEAVSPATITGYCLYMDNDPIPGYGGILIHYETASDAIYTHLQTISLPGSAPYLIAGIGATSNYVQGNQGRLLTAVYPYTATGALAQSKDHLEPDLSGTLDIQISEICPAQ